METEKVREMEEMKIDEKELFDSSTKLPTCIALDTSSSMSGPPIAELNEGLKMLYDSIREDRIASKCAEIAIVTFGDIAKVELDFATVHHQTPPILSAYGSTPMGAGINLALDIVDKRSKELSRKGFELYYPWLVIMTDGQPTDSIEEAVRRIQGLVGSGDEKERLVIFPVGIGPYADMGVLERLSPRRKPLRLQGLKFREFFKFVSRSLSQGSRAKPGENVQLEVEDIETWAEIKR